MEHDRRIAVTVRVDRRLYFTFKDLARSHRVPIERAVETALRDALQRAGVTVKDDEDALAEQAVRS